ncbi:MAG: LysM peptidoglycan-binding domain-containing protein [Anaerolineales bacterium]|nr:LysM peptidoglycan-binding domain-containing protein [Anaerolineales bacterium]
MISMVFVFYVFVGLAAAIGAVRGWAKEILVLISALLAIFIIFVFETYVGVYDAVVNPPARVYVVKPEDTCEDVARELGTTVPKMLEANGLVVDVENCQLAVNSQLSYQPLTNRFWASTTIILLLAFFGYQTPAIKLFQAGARREKVRDALLGGVVGSANGYLIFGSIWWFLEKAGYENFSKVIVPPTVGSDLAIIAENLLAKMPPVYLLDAPVIFITIVFAFLFVVIVYV